MMWPVDGQASPPRDAAAELLALALLQVGDPAAAAALVEVACARSADPDERRRLVVELAEAQRREAAARRVEAWRGLEPRHAWLAAPVVLAFAVGLAGGAGASLLRVKEPPRLELGGAPVAIEGEARFEHPGGLVAVVAHPRMREPAVVEVNGQQVASGLRSYVVVPPQLLKAGKENRITFAPELAVERLWLEAVALPSLEREALIGAAAARVREATALEGGEQTAAGYRALGLLREAKVMLELAPGTLPGALPQVKALLAGAEARLDAQCNRMLGEVRAADPAQARLLLELISDEFPGPAHGCRQQAEELAANRGR